MGPSLRPAATDMTMMHMWAKILAQMLYIKQPLETRLKNLTLKEFILDVWLGSWTNHLRALIKLHKGFDMQMQMVIFHFRLNFVYAFITSLKIHQFYKINWFHHRVLKALFSERDRLEWEFFQPMGYVYIENM